jgi:hypothetical protein
MIGMVDEDSPIPITSSSSNVKKKKNYEKPEQNRPDRRPVYIYIVLILNYFITLHSVSVGDNSKAPWVWKTERAQISVSLSGMS